MNLSCDSGPSSDYFWLKDFPLESIFYIIFQNKTQNRYSIIIQGIVITEGGIKLVAKPEQNTIILRDISSQTPSEEIMGIFTFQQLSADVSENTTESDQSSEQATSTPCPPVQSVRSDMNDTW